MTWSKVALGDTLAVLRPHYVITNRDVMVVETGDLLLVTKAVSAVQFQALHLSNGKVVHLAVTFEGDMYGVFI